MGRDRRIGELGYMRDDLLRHSFRDGERVPQAVDDLPNEPRRRSTPKLVR